MILAGTFPQIARAKRLIDTAARELDFDRVELRRKNFVRPEQMPYKTVTDHTYDTGEFAGHMDKALAEAAALLVLQNKVRAYLEDADDGTDEANEK